MSHSCDKLTVWCLQNIIPDTPLYLLDLWNRPPLHLLVKVMEPRRNSVPSGPVQVLDLWNPPPLLLLMEEPRRNSVPSQFQPVQVLKYGTHNNYACTLDNNNDSTERLSEVNSHVQRNP